MSNYVGPLKRSKHKGVRQAYNSWSNQRARCNNPKNQDYKYYGSKGVQVRYSSKEFVSWWLDNLSKRKSWRCPSVNRLDHNKDYCFENIELIEMSENSSERMSRCGRPIPHRRQPKRVIAFTPNLESRISEFENVVLAARCFNISAHSVHKHCLKKFPGLASGYTFRYVEDVD